MFGISIKIWLQSLVAFYLNNTFFYDLDILTQGYICHYVEQMFLNNILFGCEIWTEPSNLINAVFHYTYWWLSVRLQ